jgi:OmpA-OmpF porin, OOP family
MRLMPPLVWCASLVMSATASAEDLLGIYAGAGVGQSQLQQNYYQIDSHVTGWKVFGGWRPLSSLGAEVEYADLGSKNVTYVSPGGTSRISTSAKATALFAVGYLPLPEPWLDIYGKLGAARLKVDASDSFLCGLCARASYTANDTTSTRFAFGAGAQFKFGFPAVRLEYERYTASQGDQALISLAVTVNF